MACDEYVINKIDIINNKLDDLSMKLDQLTYDLEYIKRRLDGKSIIVKGKKK